MNQEERIGHARRIAQEALETIEYSDVYEDEELGGCTEGEWEDIYSTIVLAATVHIPDNA